MKAAEIKRRCGHRGLFEIRTVGQFLVALSCSIVEASDAPSQTTILQFDFLTPKCQCTVSSCCSFHHQYLTSYNYTKLSRVPYILDLSPSCIADTHIHDFQWLLRRSYQTILVSSHLILHCPSLHHEKNKRKISSLITKNSNMYVANNFWTFPPIQLALRWIRSPNQHPVSTKYIHPKCIQNS